MLRAWRLPEFRSTVDMDMLGRTSNEAADIVAQIRDIIAVKVDGRADLPHLFVNASSTAPGKISGRSANCFNILNQTSLYFQTAKLLMEINNTFIE